MLGKRIIIALVVLMGIFSFLFGCTKHNKPVDSPETGNTAAADLGTQGQNKPAEITPIGLPDGTKLTGFYMNQMGMAMMPYYIMKTTETGTYMKISDIGPDSYEMWKDDDTEKLEQPYEYFGHIDTVKDVEYASLVKVEDETVIRQLEECIEKYGALGWDGFHESKDMTGVADSGTRYSLYLELSDGTTVDMSGYNTCPPGFQELYGEVVAIFQSNSDYSRYMAQNFTDSPCTFMEVEFREKEHPYVCYNLRLRASMNQWSVILEDPDGVFLDKGTSISEYKETEEKLPFDRFLTIMSNHHVEEWNEYEESQSSGGEFYISMNFEDGKTFSARGNVYPEGFDAFKNEFIAEMVEFYKEIQ